MEITDIKKIAVIGLGTMGPGIAQVMAQAGYEVGGYDLNPLARQVIANNMGLLIEAGLAKPEDLDEALAGISMGGLTPF